jgi:hypothetical protein
MAGLSFLVGHWENGGEPGTFFGFGSMVFSAVGAERNGAACGTNLSFLANW